MLTTGKWLIYKTYGIFGHLLTFLIQWYIWTGKEDFSVEKIHSVGTINNVETSYFTQLKMCYLMTTFRCPSDILITSRLFTARWSTWPGNHLVPCVAELVGSCIPIHARRCLPDPIIPDLIMLERQAGSLVWGSRNTRKKWTLSQLVNRPEPPGQGRAVQLTSQPSQTMPWKRTMSSTGTRQKWSTERHSDRPDG